MKIKLDENLPESLLPALQALGHDADNVRSEGIEGQDDDVVWRAAENRSDLLIFEALDVAKGPIAVANMPRRVPFGFHGNWANLD